MGRANQRPRKGRHEHLAKVGSTPDLRTEGARERSAVDVMGMGNLSPAARSILFGVGTLILVAAIAALVILTLL